MMCILKASLNECNINIIYLCLRQQNNSTTYSLIEHHSKSFTSYQTQIDTIFEFFGRALTSDTVTNNGANIFIFFTVVKSPDSMSQVEISRFYLKIILSLPLAFFSLFS